MSLISHYKRQCQPILRKLNIIIMGNRACLATTDNRKNRKITENKTEVFFCIAISLPFSKEIESNVTYKNRQDYRDLYNRNIIYDFLQ